MFFLHLIHECLHVCWRIRSASMCMHLLAIQSALAGGHDVLLQRPHRHFSWSCSYVELSTVAFSDRRWDAHLLSRLSWREQFKRPVKTVTVPLSRAARLPPPHCWNTKFNRLLSNLFQADSGYCKALGNVKCWTMSRKRAPLSSAEVLVNQFCLFHLSFQFSLFWFSFSKGRWKWGLGSILERIDS